MFNNVPSYQAADDFDKALLNWHVRLKTLDEDLRAKEKIEARVYDLWRNNPFMHAIVEKQVDALVGAQVILMCQPDFVALGVSQQEAADWSAFVEREFGAYANSPDNWISADRSMNFTQLVRQVARATVMTGESFITREFRKSPLRYSTCFQPISSYRVKSPSSVQDGRVFHGIEFDEFGEATAYHIESARLDQRQSFGNKKTNRVPRRNAFNWLQVFHTYESVMAEYPRGISRLACVIKPMMQHGRLEESLLDKHIIAANYVLAITSDESPESVADMLSGAAGVSGFAVDQSVDYPPDVKAKRDEILQNITQRVINLTGGHNLHLFADEKAEILQASPGGETSGDFSAHIMRSVANGAGMSFAYATGDFSGLSFSGGQMALGLYENSVNIQRQLTVYKSATLMFRCWLDEAMFRGDMPLLGGQEYWPNREAYTRCSWTGASIVQVDRLKNSKANSQDLANILASRRELASASGKDFEKIISERANEAALIVDAIKSVAESRGAPLSPADTLKLIVEIVGTAELSAPEPVIEVQQDEQD